MAAITSAGTGPSNVGGTWTGGVVPGAGDTVTIQAGHTVTLPLGVTWTVGAAPATDAVIKAIDVVSGGQFVHNGALNCRGDFRCSASNAVRSHVVGPGATFTFDFSATTDPTNQVYKYIQPAQWPGTQPSLLVNGAEGDECEFTAEGGGRWYFQGSGANYFSLMEVHYCAFSGLGTATVDGIRPSITGDGSSDPGTKFIIEDCTFDDCYAAVNTNGVSIDARAVFKFNRNKFTNSLGTICLRTDSYGARLGTNSVRQVIGNTFDKKCYFYSPSNMVIKENFIPDGWLVTGGVAKWDEFSANIVHITSTAHNDPVIAGHAFDNLFLFDALAATNPHLSSVGSYNVSGTYNVYRNIFKFTGTDPSGDCITLGTPSGGITSTINVYENIVLPNEAGESTGTLWSGTSGVSSQADLTINIDHNTAFLGTGGGIALQETPGGAYEGHAGMYGSIRSNLFWDTSARAYKVFDSGTDNTKVDLVSATYLDYNGGFNFLAGDGDGYNNLEFGSGTPGANDVSGDPEFVDSTADLATWDDSLGGPGTIAGAIARFKADPTTLAAFRTFIQEGFAPTNTDYEDAAHDGTTIGAVAFSGVVAATSLALTGPTSGLVNTASTNFTVTPNGVFTGTVTPTVTGGGTFIPSTLSWTAESTAKTFTYTPVTAGSKTIGLLNDGGLANPATIGYTSNATPATTFTFSGPSGGIVGVPSTNFSVTPNGSYTGSVTPSAGGGGGSFTPSSLSWSNALDTKTFTYTPTTPGVKTIALANSGALTEPTPLSYTASSGTATSFTFTGPTEGEVNLPSTSFVVTPNGSYNGTVTPVAVGGGSFSPAVLTWNNTEEAKTFVYIPTTEGGKTLSLSNSGGLTNPSSISFTSTPRTATAISYLGPSEGYVGEVSSDFTVIPDGVYTGTITPSAGIGGGTFNPTYLTWDESSVAKYFNYTPATEGDKTITLTPTGGITVPGTISYKASRRVVTKSCVDPCDYYPFNQPSCGDGEYSAPGGPSPCSPHYPSLLSNFNTPAANVPIIVKVTDTSMFYVGQGVKIGPTYYQIMDILSSTSLQIQHDGIGATVGLSYIATHPALGCYQYPITPAGYVAVQKALTVKGRSNTGVVIASSVNLTGSQNILSYGYKGPKRVEMDVSFEATIANSPYQISIDLPKNRRSTASPLTSFSASFYDGTKWISLATILGLTEVFFVKPDNTPMASAATFFRASGSYEAQ